MVAADFYLAQSGNHVINCPVCFFYLNEQCVQSEHEAGKILPVWISFSACCSSGFSPLAVIIINMEVNDYTTSRRANKKGEAINQDFTKD